MSKNRIPEEVKQQVDEIVDNFNRTVLKDPERYYTPRYRGKYLYLDRVDYGVTTRVCRLEYTGDTDDWNFAIFKYSDERYATSEFFPGMGHLDGTVEGAMRAGLEAYP